MGKGDQDVVKEFNEYVNMSTEELEKWLKEGSSEDAGWTGGSGGETVGHESGRKIIQILNNNPSKDPNKYSAEDLAHMRKVASYCKRHLAQEKKLIDQKSEAEFKKSRSYRSLKNWGHDPLKTKSNSGKPSKEGRKRKAPENSEEQAGPAKAGKKRKETAAKKNTGKTASDTSGARRSGRTAKSA